jgi:hypothetical protein
MACISTFVSISSTSIQSHPGFWIVLIIRIFPLKSTAGDSSSSALIPRVGEQVALTIAGIGQALSCFNWRRTAFSMQSVPGSPHERQKVLILAQLPGLKVFFTYRDEGENWFVIPLPTATI